MPRPRLLPSFLALAALALGGCGAPAPFRAQPPAGVQAARAVGALTGRLEAPPLLKLLATSGDVAAYAAVVLRDAGGTLVSTGTTDAAGSFTLLDAKSGFALHDGDVFTLEAVKRVDGALMSLRTLVERQGGAWRSITGPAVELSLATSTLVKLRETNPALAPGDLLDKVDPATGAFSAVGAFSPADLDRLRNSLSAALSEGFNPSGRLGKGRFLRVGSQADLDRIAAYTEADVIVVNAPDVTRLSLPNLKRVKALGVIDSPSLQSVELPALESCGEFALQALPALATVAMPALSRWACGIVDQCGPGLTSLAIPAGCAYDAALNTTHLYNTWHDEIRVSGCPGLGSLSLPPAGVPPEIEFQHLPALASLGSAPWARTSYTIIDIHDCALEDLGVLAPIQAVSEYCHVGNLPALSAFELPSLATIGNDLWLYGLGNATFGLPQLQTIGQNLTIEDSGLGGATALSLPALTTLTHQLKVARLNVATLDFPALATLGSTDLEYDLPNLQVCDTAPWYNLTSDHNATDAQFVVTGCP